MYIRCASLIMLFIINLSVAYSQSADSLLSKADSFYESKQYAESARMYERLFAVSKNISGIEYYNAACSFALSGNSQKALYYLEQSFQRPSRQGQPTISIDHLASDSDLDSIRELAGFNALIVKFYSLEDASYIRSKELSYVGLTDYINAKIKKEQWNIEIRDKTIYWKKDGANYVNNSRSEFYESHIIASEKANIKFINCIFEFNVLFGKRTEDFRMDYLAFDHCQFKHDLLILNLNLDKPLSFSNCLINGGYILTNIVNAYRDDVGRPTVAIDSCTISSGRLNIDAYSNSPIDIKITNNKVNDSTVVSVLGNSIANLEVRNNHAPGAFLKIEGNEIGSLALDGNQFESIAIFNSQISSKFNLTGTEVTGHFYLGNSSFNESPSNRIRWSSFADGKLAYLKKFQFVKYDDEQNRPIHKPVFCDGRQSNDFENADDFAGMMGIYSLFLNQYRSNNDLESFNRCFIAIKELQSKRLEYLYRTHGGFEPYFRWRLSQLLKFYVRYGTDPGRAIVISIYIILLFGVFFFFFPSDWDVTSKGKLIQNYKDFIEKNEKGYIKPFFKLVKGFIVSLVNAVTLSLNAFITLGFGNIPTRGIARYFCVLEGFLGWFLLSIFTVALINQTL